MKTRRLVVSAKSAIEIEEIDMPDPGPGELLIENVYTGISPGTELAFIHHLPNTSGRYPFYPGYSGCGRVLKAGREVDGFQAGDLVAYAAQHRSHAVAPAARCHPVGGIDPKQAAFFRLGSIALQGVRKARIQVGNDCLVIGLGPIGLLAAQLARVNGAFVEGIDPIDWRRDLARAAGVECVASRVSGASRHGAYAVVIEATGAAPVINEALQAAARLGRVVLLGSTRGITEGVNFYRDVHIKGLEVIGAHESIRATGGDYGRLFSAHTDEATILRLMQAGRFSTASLASDVVGPDGAPSAYARLNARQEKLMSIAIKWSDE